MTTQRDYTPSEDACWTDKVFMIPVVLLLVITLAVGISAGFGLAHALELAHERIAP